MVRRILVGGGWGGNDKRYEIREEYTEDTNKTIAD